jgi:hypothetical protein
MCRWMGRFIVLAITLGLISPIPSSESQTHKCILPTITSPNDIQTLLPPEGRLRRLYLVRPDLMPYPIEVRTFC